MSRIRRVPGLVGGRPTLTGRRLTAYNLVSQSCYATNEAELREYLTDFELTLADLQVALTYCYGLRCLKAGGPFCSGCTLQREQDGPDYLPDALQEVEVDGEICTRSTDGSLTFPGTKAEYYRSEQGQAGWLMAADVQQRFAALLPGKEAWPRP